MYPEQNEPDYVDKYAHHRTLHMIEKDAAWYVFGVFAPAWMRKWVIGGIVLFWLTLAVIAIVSLARYGRI